MKHPNLIIALAGLTALTATASAEEDAQRPQAPNRAEIIAKFDADGDGILNETERQAAREAMAKRAEEEKLRRFDTNGDGILDDAERRAAREAMANEAGES